MVCQIPGQDRREKIIQLTELGEEIYQICRVKITEMEYRVMEGISEHEQNIAFEILPKIQSNLMNREDNKNE